MIFDEAVIAQAEYDKIQSERKESDWELARSRAKARVREINAQMERDSHAGNDEPVSFPTKAYWMGKPFDELEQAELLKAANYLMGEVTRLRGR